MVPLKGKENIIVDGSREEGKTTLAMSLANQCHAGKVVFDQRAMIEGVIVYGPDELEDAIDAQVWKDGPIVYRFDSMDVNEEFAAFCGVLFPPRFPRGGFAVIVDEAGRLQSATHCDPNLERIIRQHPTKGGPDNSERVMIIQTMHTLSESCSDLRSLIDEYYIFRLTNRNDLAAIEKLTGIPELQDIVKDLPQHHCIRYINSRRPEGMPQFYILDDPGAWHIRATNQDDSEKILDSEGSQDENEKRKKEWTI